MMGAFSRLQQVLPSTALAVVCSGCLPHVLHGPRVEDEGFSGALSLTLGHNREIDEQLEILPSLYGGLRWSRVVGPEGTALSLGLQVPVLVAPFLSNDGGREAFDILTATSYADLYVQPSRTADPGTEWGVGVLASRSLAAPYIQLGRMNPDGSGWFTTQLVAISIDDDLILGGLYLPSVAYRVINSERSAATNLSAGFGLGFAGSGGTDALVTLGVTMELGLGRN